jgi:phosphatidylinositol 4-kinase
MGRTKVNDLLDPLIEKHGGEHTITFQRARLNFIQSMAAYYVTCYTLPIKGRYNKNILIDGEGHIVHIGMRNLPLTVISRVLTWIADFGFLFEIDKCIYSRFSFPLLTFRQIQNSYGLE